MRQNKYIKNKFMEIKCDLFQENCTTINDEYFFILKLIDTR